MATGMHMDEWSVDCLVLGHHDQDKKVSAKSVTMRGTTFKWLQRIALKQLTLKLQEFLNDIFSILESIKIVCQQFMLHQKRDPYQTLSSIYSGR